MTLPLVEREPAPSQIIMECGAIEHPVLMLYDPNMAQALERGTPLTKYILDSCQFEWQRPHWGFSSDLLLYPPWEELTLEQQIQVKEAQIRSFNKHLFFLINETPHNDNRNSLLKGCRLSPNRLHVNNALFIKGWQSIRYLVNCHDIGLSDFTRQEMQERWKKADEYKEVFLNNCRTHKRLATSAGLDSEIYEDNHYWHNRLLVKILAFAGDWDTYLLGPLPTLGEQEMKRRIITDPNRNLRILVTSPWGSNVAYQPSWYIETVSLADNPNVYAHKSSLEACSICFDRDKVFVANVPVVRNGKLLFTPGVPALELDAQSSLFDRMIVASQIAKDCRYAILNYTDFSDVQRTDSINLKSLINDFIDQKEISPQTAYILLHTIAELQKSYYVHSVDTINYLEQVGLIEKGEIEPQSNLNFVDLLAQYLGKSKFATLFNTLIIHARYMSMGRDDYMGEVALGVLLQAKDEKLIKDTLIQSQSYLI